MHSVDAAGVDEQMRRYDQIAYEQFGRNEATDLKRPTQVMDAQASSPDVGENFVYPVGWTTNSCGYFQNSIDPLAGSSTPLNERGRKVVTVWTESGRGSGTMIDDRHILTAAHVVTLSDGTHEDLVGTGVDVCTYGNRSANASSGRQHEVNCYSVGWIHTRSSWKGFGKSTDYINWDYAIITLNSVLVSPFNFGWMALSQASGSTLVQHSDFHRGYPGSESDCTANSFTGVASGFVGLKASDSDGEPDTVMSATINYTTSTATGMSGGPHYYCPNGSCDDGHWITGVQSGAWVFAGLGASNGPRASTFRDWVNGTYAFNYL